MTDTLTKSRPATAGNIFVSSNNWPAIVDDVAEPMLYSAYDLVSMSDELPSIDLASKISADNFVMVILNQNAYEEVTAGNLTGSFELVASPEVTEPAGAPGASEDEGHQVFASNTFRLRSGWLQTLAATVPEAFTRPAIQKYTWGTFVNDLEPCANIRRLHRELLGGGTAVDEHSEMESDYPNLVRAIRSGQLEDLTASIAPRVARAPEEPWSVDVEWQVKFGATGDAPTEDRPRRLPLHDGLFDD